MARDLAPTIVRRYGSVQIRGCYRANCSLLRPTQSVRSCLFSYRTSSMHRDFVGFTSKPEDRPRKDHLLFEKKAFKRREIWKRNPAEKPSNE